MNTPQLVLPQAEHIDHPLDRFGRGFVLALVIFPFLAVIYGIWQIWGEGVDLFYLSLLFLSCIFRELGITIAFHRLFTHESFKASKAFKIFWGACGSAAYQGTPLAWCSKHSKHHQCSDAEGDPHSPWMFGTSPLALFKGFWHAHFVWLFSRNQVIENGCTERLRKDEVICFVDRHTVLWMVLSGILPALLGFIHESSLLGVWRGFLWGGLISLFFVQHNTWSVNSICHIWGKKTFKSPDESRDNWFVMLITLGEGAHNGHHAFAWSAVHAILHRWSDASYLVIKLHQMFGSVWDVRVPTPAQIEAKLIKA
ncbi:MAG: fatty acid desaturase [Candidatus Paceibacterota bacterium]